MNELDREFFEEYKKFYPGMNLEMIRLFAQIMMALHHLPILMEGYFHKMGLTRGRFMVLIQLYRRPDEGLSIRDIRNFHKVQSATMTGIIDTLEREGQIERVSDPTDRRKVIVRITRAGRELMEKFLPKHQENIKQILFRFSNKDRQDLLELLERLLMGISTVIGDEGVTVGDHT
jgi:DNA-binding MarR family transcriptional regulator